MVDGQIRTFDVTDQNVIEAFDLLPRERFLPADLRTLAYSDARPGVEEFEPGRA